MGYEDKFFKQLIQDQKIAIVDAFGEYPYSYVEHLNVMFKHDLDEGVIKSKIEKTWGVLNTNAQTQIQSLLG